MEQTTMLTTEELATIKKMQADYSEITAKLGRLSVQKMLMETDLKSITSEIENQHNLYKQTNETETGFLQTISEKYGDGTVNLETGEFSKK